MKSGFESGFRLVIGGHYSVIDRVVVMGMLQMSIMKRPVLYCVSLILVMLVTGVFWGTWFTLTRSLSSFPPDNFIRIGKTIINNVAWPMRILMPATVVMLVWLCVATAHIRPSFYFFLGTLILMIITLVITVSVEVPIDNQIKTWTPETLPSNWTDLRATWDRFHTLRMLTSVLSFVSLSVGVVLGLADSHTAVGFRH